MIKKVILKKSVLFLGIFVLALAFIASIYTFAEVFAFILKISITALVVSGIVFVFLYFGGNNRCRKK